MSSGAERQRDWQWFAKRGCGLVMVFFNLKGLAGRNYSETRLGLKAKPGDSVV